METTKIVYGEKYNRGMQILDYMKEMKFENVRVDSLYGVTFYYVNNIKNVCKLHGCISVSIKIESIIFKDDTLTLITKGDIIQFHNVKLMDEVTLNGN